MFLRNWSPSTETSGPSHRLNFPMSSPCLLIMNSPKIPVNEATDTLCSSQASYLNNLCPLTSKPARNSPPSPWLTEVREQRMELKAAKRKWREYREPTDLSDYQGLLASFYSSLKIAKSTYYQNKTCGATDAWKMFSAFNSLLNPPPPPPSNLLTADMFALFFIDKGLCHQ